MAEAVKVGFIGAHGKEGATKYHKWVLDNRDIIQKPIQMETEENLFSKFKKGIKKKTLFDQAKGR